MKLIEGNLYLEFAEAVECGMNEKYLRKAKSTGAKSFRFLDDPDDRRKVLIDYESLKPQYKEQVEKRFGNPYDHLAKEPIRKMVTKDLKAEEYYLSYRYDGNKHLPIDAVNKYTTAASWLNMLVKADADKKEIKRLLNLSITEFFVKVLEIVISDGINLPTHYKRLKPKIAEYKAKGYDCLIHKNYGNTNTLKVNSEVAESLLLELISQPYHDDIVICRKYNEWAAQNGHEQIVPGTVGVWRRSNEHLILSAKEGNKVAYNKYGKQIMRKRPSAPLLRVESDDNELDLYFLEIKEKGGRTIKNYFYRPVLYVVKDSFNDYILGYAFGESVTADVIRAAYLDAIHHIKDLTGSYYLPHDLQTDRWGLDRDLTNDLAMFYKGICQVYMPATPKNARSKYIEQSFGGEWHKLLKFYPNYSGHNVTAKGKINEDYLQLQKSNFPTVDKAPYQIEQFINGLRNLVDEKTGLSKQMEWLQAFENSEKSKRQPISDMQMLQLFGTRHTVASASNPEYPNRITNRGITPAINCKERTYEIPEEFYLLSVGKQVQVVYDPLDYSRILVTDGGNLRFIAHEYSKSPSATLDFTEGDRIILNNRLEEKKRLAEVIARKKKDRQGVLQRARIDAEGMLQAGIVVPKLEKQQATLAYQKRLNGGEYDPLDDM